ncbi:uncharacterized protein LOC116146557 [Pistacia vera]|uniref:uncharacterized protein LOC116146557 n=1 Tax=Pistacia vera TaxID=55513 RepID=UPI001262DF47|nr:uncharacterized protein LOC116146557 [Pistacia vera]
MGCPEDTRLLENSGWSSRTRAVAKYLQTLFENEPVQGRKVLALDNLLAGKTRKEARRMFFETLVCHQTFMDSVFSTRELQSHMRVCRSVQFISLAIHSSTLILFIVHNEFLLTKCQVLKTKDYPGRTAEGLGEH